MKDKILSLTVAKTPQNTGGGNSHDLTARTESAQTKNTSLRSGCGAVDVIATSYGAPDEHPMSTRSASDGARWKPRGRKGERKEKKGRRKGGGRRKVERKEKKGRRKGGGRRKGDEREMKGR